MNSCCCPPSSMIVSTLEPDKYKHSKITSENKNDQWDECIQVKSYIKDIPVDTGRKLNVHKTFRRRPGRLLNVFCTFNLRPVSTGIIRAEAVTRR